MQMYVGTAPASPTLVVTTLPRTLPEGGGTLKSKRPAVSIPHAVRTSDNV
jgi:hypothetical protein